MRKNLRRSTALLLAVLMLMSVVQVPLLAAEPEAPSVLLPVADDVSVQQMQADLPAVQSGEEAVPVYLSRLSASTELPGMTIQLDADSSFSESSARIQAVDARGSVVGQTAAGSLYYSYTGKQIRLNSRQDLYLLEPPLAVGDYKLQIVYGADLETIEIEGYVLRVVDAPVITDGYLNLSSGSDSSKLNLTIYGYKGDATGYSFQLIGADETVIACEAKFLGLSSVYNAYGAAKLNWTLTPKTPLTDGESYSLQISAPDGVYTNLSALSDTPYNYTRSTHAILDVQPDPAVIGGLIVTAGGVTAGQEYTVTAENENDESYYSGKLTPVMDSGVGAFRIALKKNGFEVPLSVFAGTNIEIRVADESGNSDYFTFRQNSYSSQSTSLDLTQTAAGKYAFELEGRGLLSDLYRKKELVLTLKGYSREARTYTVLASCSDVTKTAAAESGRAVYRFTGTFETNANLSGYSHFAIFCGDENLATQSAISGADSGSFQVDSYYYHQIETQGNQTVFWFNFGVLPFSATYVGATEAVRAELYEIGTNTIVSTADEQPEKSGEWSTFLLPQPENMSTEKSYGLRLVSGSASSVVFGEERREPLHYSASVKVPDYLSLQTPIFEGDTSLLFTGLSNSSMRNLPADYFTKHPFRIIHEGADAGEVVETAKAEFSDNAWSLTLALKEPLVFGTYSYSNDLKISSTFNVLPKDVPVIGSAYTDRDSGLLEVRNCRNLAEGTYTGTLYDINGGLGKVKENLTFTRASDALLTLDASQLSSLEGGSYSLEIRLDGAYLGIVSCYLGSYNDVDCVVRGYNEYSAGQGEIVYETVSNTIYLQTMLAGYDEVRYSEDQKFSGVEYRPIRERYDQSLKLSSGTGKKTVYVQFRNAEGAESAVYVWCCYKVNQLTEAKVIDAWIEVDDERVTRVPKYATFTLNLTTRSPYTGAYVKFVEADGSVYRETYALSFAGQQDDGTYLFSREMYSNGNPFAYYTFTKIQFYLTDMSGADWIGQKELPVSFGDADIQLDAWPESYDRNTYTNQTSFTVSGTATPNAEITLQIGWDADTARTVTTDASGRFSFELTGLEEQRYDLQFSCGEDLDRSVDLIVDLTAPVLSELKATPAKNGSAAITWKCSENYVTYHLWRDGVLISSDMEDTTFLAVNAFGARFEVQAFDRAGNTSKKLAVAVNGDTIAPSAPGAPNLLAHGTKSLSFDWTAATDNVGVYEYKVYRGDALLATLPAATLTYTDTALDANTEYTYSVYAYDRAGNESEPATAKLRTAELKISTQTTFQQEYVKEENPNGIMVSVTPDTSDVLYSGARTAEGFFQYKLAETDNWTELALGNRGTRSAKWMIEDLTPGTYTVRFQLKDTEGTTAESKSQTVAIKQDSTPPTVQITAPVKDLTYGGKSLNISGTATDNVLATRVVLRYTQNGQTADITELKNEKNAATFVWQYTFDASQLPSGEITLTAEAFDARNNAAAATVSIKLDNTPPETPGGFQVRGDSEKISVLWTYPKQTTDTDLAGFRVYRAEAADGAFTKVFEDLSFGYYDSASQTGIESGKTYYYYVTAFDKYGNESTPTATRSGAMSDDKTPPTIVSFVPASGRQLCKQATISVSLTDNSLLGSLQLAYRAKGAETWTELQSFDLTTTPTGSAVRSFDWDISELAGDYELRIMAIDAAGNKTEQTASYTIASYDAPKAPTLTVTEAGHRALKLSWTCAGRTDLLSRIQVLRKTAGDTEYKTIAALNAAETSYTDTGLIAGQAYTYKIRAVDRWSMAAESTEQTATAPNQDTEAPKAVIAAENLLVRVGQTINFSAAGSSDNDEIASYSWSFGDGATGTGVTAAHAFEKAGRYTVTLTVTDHAGNSAAASAAVEAVAYEAPGKDGIYEITFSVVKADGATPLAGTELKVLQENDETVSTLISGADGKASLLLREGSYRVQAIRDPYLPRTLNLKVGEGQAASLTIEMSESSMLVGSLTHKEMTYEEIKEAGIDVNDPDNQHVFRFSTVLTFSPEPKYSFDIPLNYYVNSKGTVLHDIGDGTVTAGGGGFSFTFNGWTGRVYPVSRDAYLIIYGEARWLKEMFQVQLLLNNTSSTQTVTNAVAELQLPDGLSLAGMRSAPQTLRVSLDDIAPQATSVTNWYVRGDKEGKYALTADVSGVWEPGSEPFKLHFITDEDLEVLAGSALHLYVEAERSAKKGQDYRVKFRLENVSDKELYDVSLNIFGGKFFEKYSVSDLEYDGTGKLDGEWNNGTGAVSAKTLKPGESIEGIFCIVFDADYIEKDVRYLLTDMFVHTMEGSTTEIPTTLSFMNNEDLAIVVVPGILGSELYRTTADTSLWQKVWLPAAVDEAGTYIMNGSYIQAVQYVGAEAALYHLLNSYKGEEASEDAKLYVTEVWNSLKADLNTLHAQDEQGNINFGKVKVRDPSSSEFGTARTSYDMMEAMRTVTENVYLFSYDWRGDNTKAAGKLKKLIDSLNAQEKEVIIVAHSMGGLVTSSYVQQNGDEAVSKIITCGTPYLGTPKGAYMMELVDNAEKLASDALVFAIKKGIVLLSGKIAGKVFDLGFVKEFIFKQAVDPLVESLMKEFEFDKGIEADAEKYLKEIGVSTLAQYYDGLYQLLPSPAYGSYMYEEIEEVAFPKNKVYNKKLNVTETQILLNSAIEHYENPGDHAKLIQDAYDFHEQLGESGRHVMLQSRKTWFIVGSGMRTIDQLIARSNDKDNYEYSFEDIQVKSGDGTVTTHSATIGGKLPEERTLYLKKVHTPMFADNATINAIKGLIYGDTSAFDEEGSSVNSPLKAYTKVKVECPVDVYLTQDGQTLSSTIGAANTQTDFGEMYLLGKDLDIKVAFVDDGGYDLRLNATDSGTMTLTVEYYDGVNNETPVKSRTFTDVPLTKDTVISAKVLPSAEIPASGTDGMTLQVDTNGDGTTDQVINADNGETPTPVVPATRVSLNRGKIEMARGTSMQLAATVAPENATEKALRWETSDPDVVTVDANGVVTAQANGEAEITVSVTANPARTDTCHVIVKETSNIVYVTGVTLTPDSAELTVGGTMQLTATVAPAGATTKTVTWQSSDTNVAAVDENGKVTAAAAGTATITVKTADGGYTASCAITVKAEKPAVSKVTLNMTSAALTVGGTTQLTVTVEPAGAGGTVSWASGDSKVASVDANGKVTAVGAGTTTITATVGGKSASCTVTVTPAPVTVAVTGIRLDNAEISVGGSIQLTPKFTPENTTQREVTWQSSKPAVATVDETGLVKGLAAGKTVITVTSAANPAITAHCTVTVTKTGGGGTGGIGGGAIISGISGIGGDELPFNDVSFRNYYYSAVKWAVDKGITTGTGRYTFSPDAACTRAQVVTFLWRAAGSPAPMLNDNPFTDVHKSDYYYDAVLWAVQNGITNGTSAKTFSPNATVTRAQVVTFLWRSQHQPDAAASGFTDVSTNAYYAKAVDWAFACGITTGMDHGTFAPDAACTRAQIVTFLYRSAG